MSDTYTTTATNATTQSHRPLVARLATVKDDDHSAWIIIAASLSVALILVFAGIRIFIRRVISPGVGLDDGLLAAATIFGCVEAALLLGACHVGLGRSAATLTHHALSTTRELYYAAMLFFALGIGFSKASVAAFLLRIAPFNPHRRMVKIIFVLIVAWTITLLFVLALRCNLTRPWRVSTAACSDTIILRWEILDAFGCTFELAMFALSIWLVWGVSALSLMHKSVVVVMFGFRLPVILFALLRLMSFPRSSTWDPTLHEAEFISWSQAELCYSLIASTILVMRPFIHTLVTQYGGSGKTTARPDDEAHMMLPLKSGCTASPSRSDSVPSISMATERQGSEVALARTVLPGSAGHMRQMSMF